MGCTPEGERTQQVRTAASACVERTLGATLMTSSLRKCPSSNSGAVNRGWADWIEAVVGSWIRFLRTR